MQPDATRNGYHLALWTMGDLVYRAVSDTGWGEIRAVVRLLQDLSAGDSRQ